MVTLRILDASGRLVKTLVHEIREPGWYTVHWDGRDNRGHPVPGGTYFYSIAAGEFRATRKATLIR